MQSDKIIIIVCMFALLLLIPVAFRDFEDSRRFRLQRKASEHPYEDRDWHRRFAVRHGYFWHPCPSCGKSFGGHESLGKTIPHPDPRQAQRGKRAIICPPCSLPLRPPNTNTAKKQSRKTRY